MQLSPPSSSESSGSSVEIALVPFHHGEPPADHPDLQPLLRKGWRIKRAELRLVEGGHLKYLVVLHRAPLDAPIMSQRPPLPASLPSTTSSAPSASSTR